MTYSAEELGAKMDALGVWELLEPYNFAVKPKGTVFPYFCTALKGERKPVKVRFLMLEGWQTLHDFVHTRFDNNFGFYSTPAEMPHLELVVVEGGAPVLFRHDPGYMPQPATDAQRALAERILWEAFISFPKSDVKKAADLPFATEDAFEVDFGIVQGVMTKDPRPRAVYALVAVDAKTGERLVDARTSISPDGGLRSLWESMPPQFLRELIRIGRVPGEVKVRSLRMFRMLRPLCDELPFKLSVHDKLERLP